MQTISQILAQELNCRQEYIENVIALLDEGNTIPFIARYRKEQHGAMDDTALRTLETRLQYLRNLAQRREEVKSSIAAQEKLTDELARAIDEAKTLAEVEDLYRPYKPKRRTRATIAKEKGLEPLADAIFAQTMKMAAPETLAQAYLDPEKGVETIEDALAGASDILAERVSDDADVRKSLRALMNRRGTAQSAAAKDEEDDKTAVYRQYFAFSQPISLLQSHQVLALNRGEREGYLKWLFDFEYRLLELPEPDRVVYLDLPTELSEQMMRRREQATGTKADIHERDEGYLAACRESAELVISLCGWEKIDCSRSGAVRTPEDIHREVLARVEDLLVPEKG